MNRQWTREDDRRIAERCEGLKVLPRSLVTEGPDGLFNLSHYNTDLAAAHRAAEAWRTQRPGRWYECRSDMQDQFGVRPSSVGLFERGMQLAASAPTLHEGLLAACEKEESNANQN